MRHLRRGVLVRLRGVARLRAMVPRAQAVPFDNHAAVPIDVKVEAERVPEREAMPFGRRRAVLIAVPIVRILQVHLHTGRGTKQKRQDLEAADPGARGARHSRRIDAPKVHERMLDP